VSEGIANPANPANTPPAAEPSDAELMAALGMTPEKPAAPAAKPEPKAEEPAEEAEPVAEDEQDPGDEPPADDAAEKPKPAAPAINADRVIERLFGQYNMPPDAIAAMDDATRLKTAESLAMKVLTRAGIPKRFIDQMTPEERIAEAIPHRVRQRQQDRAGVKPRSTELNGEGRTAQPQARPGVAAATDPLDGIGDELGSIDPEAVQKVRGVVKGVQDELAQVKRELSEAKEFRRASNFADAFVAVLEESPGLRGQHQAIREALNDLPGSEHALDTPGEQLVELVRRAAEDFGYVPQSPAQAAAPKAAPRSAARNTPPKPSARGGGGRVVAKALTPDEQDARELRALAAANFDEAKARELLRTGKV